MSRKRIIVLVCALVVMAAAIAVIVIYSSAQKEAGDIYEDLQEKVELPPVTTPTQPVTPAEPEPPQEPEVPAEPEEPTEPAEPEEPVEPYVSPIDFGPIWEINEDVYAWIDIPDTDISYPVVQHPTDDSYYLDHTIEGKARYPGSIYTESWNAKDFSDFLTVVYGHNMKNGTMFGMLRKFRAKEYMNEHPLISFYTPEGEYHYRVFAAVAYSNAYLPSAFNYETPEGREAFIDSILGARDLTSYVNKDIEVTPDDQLVVLSTCMGNDNYRLLVVGVKDKEISTK